MQGAKLDRTIFKIHRWSGYILGVLIFVYFLSGYGITKRILPMEFSKLIHEKYLPLPTVLAFLGHVIFYFYFSLKKKMGDSIASFVYILSFSVLFFLLFLYLYLR